MKRRLGSRNAVIASTATIMLIAAFAACVTDGVGTIECENGLKCPPQTVCFVVDPEARVPEYRCDPASCGDELVDRGNGELCDDGNRVNGDGCSASCRIIESCGDGKLDPGEGCDSSAPNSPLPCGDDCRPLLNCGDGTLNPEEDCDEGISGTPHATPTCNDNCRVPWCGDGNTNESFVNPGTGRPEECDVGGENTAACDADCTFPECGDGLRNSATDEQCDGGDADTVDCDEDCTPPTCGDGHLNEVAGEQCGESMDADGMPVTPVDTQTCDADCTAAVCGDGHRNTPVGEQCDDGTDSATCNGPAAPTGIACKLKSCGDGYRNLAALEFCDDGNPFEFDDCPSGPSSQSAACKPARCGDGVVRLGVEQCDPAFVSNGPANNTAGCDSDCTLVECGDRHENGIAGETCDDGNDNDLDACPDGLQGTCKDARCGDGFLRNDLPPDHAQAEQCDDGNDDDNDACPSGTTVPAGRRCQDARCGDGFERSGEEDCDDGNQSNSDACLNSCNDAACGDGFLQSGVEQCDVGFSCPSETPTCTGTCVCVL